MDNRFSIIIPACNRPNDLSGCIKGLLRNSNSYDIEIIISDDSCSEKELKHVEEEYNNYDNIRFVNGPKKGPAANRNNGAKNASGNWLIFLDDDCVPSADLLINYMHAIVDKRDYRVFEGAIVCLDKKLSPLEYTPVNEHGGKLWSCNFMIDRDLFFRIGGFDENYRYPHMEDIDLRRRLITCGEKIHFIKEAYVSHPLRKIKSGFKLGRYQEMYLYYKNKYKEPTSLSELLFSILKVHYSMAKGFFFHKDFALAVLVMLQHSFYVFIKYNDWTKKYAKTS